MKLIFHTYDVFTARKFAGNPLAVVEGADGLTTPEMQTIAREFNLSETIFVMAPDDPANTYTVVSYLEKAGYGAKASGPVVKCIFEALSGKIALDPVVLANPLDQTVLLPAAPYPPLLDTTCLNSPFDNFIRD